MERPAAPLSVPAYDRAALDGFFAAAAVERGRLEREIAAERQREGRASASLDEVAASFDRLRDMVVGLYGELNALREQGAAEAAELVRQADHEAAEILAAARRGASGAAPAGFVGGQAPGTGVPEAAAVPPTAVGPTSTSVEALELRPRLDSQPDPQPEALPPAPRLVSTDAIDSSAEGYFAYLRGALADDTPLGPSSGTV